MPETEGDEEDADSSGAACPLPSALQTKADATATSRPVAESKAMFQHNSPDQEASKLDKLSSNDDDQKEEEGEPRAIKKRTQEEEVDEEEEEGDEEKTSGDEEEEEEAANKFWPPPIEVTMRMVHSFSGKTISAFAFDQRGVRFASGGHDGEVKIWDFRRPTPVGGCTPATGAVIQQLDYSPDDRWLLVVPANCQALVVARDGTLDAKAGVCIKGDQYISDMAHTRGHVQMLNDGQWRPRAPADEFITCSNDGTVRLWNALDLSAHKALIKCRAPVGGLRVAPTVCKYTRDSLSIAAGCQDGSVLMWDTRRKFLSSSACIRAAHARGAQITGLDFAHNRPQVCTRADDESCKLWDLRQLKSALAARSDLPSAGHAAVDCCFSPDDQLVVSGTAAETARNCGGGGGEVHFMDSRDLATRRALSLEPRGDGAASVLRCRWHPKINHLAYTSSDGQVCVTYDRRRSSSGGFVPAAAAAAASGSARRAQALAAPPPPPPADRALKRRKNAR